MIEIADLRHCYVCVIFTRSHSMMRYLWPGFDHTAFVILFNKISQHILLSNRTLSSKLFSAKHSRTWLISKFNHHIGQLFTLKKILFTKFIYFTFIPENQSLLKHFTQFIILLITTCGKLHFQKYSHFL